MQIRTAHMLLLVFTLAGFTVLAPDLTAQAPTKTRIFRFPIMTKVDVHRPGSSVDRSSRVVIGALYEGLTTFTPDSLDVVGGVAKSWKVGADRKSYIFFLRDEARWTNGKRVTAADFIRGWSDVVTRPEYFPNAHLLLGSIANAREYYKDSAIPEDAPIIEAQALSETILKVTLTRPIVGFLELLTLPVFLPKPAPVEKKPSTIQVQQSLPVSNGAFRLKAQEDRLIVLEKSPHYWGKRQVQLDEVHIEVEPNPFAVIYKFNSGTFHWSGAVDLSGLSGTYLESKSRRIYRGFRRLFFLEFDELKEAYKDSAVRRALSLAMDRPLLSTYVVTSSARKSSGFVLRGLDRYQPRYFLGFSPKKARKQLDKAGYCTKGTGRTACTPLTPIRIMHDDSDLQKKMAHGIANVWSTELGIDVKVLPEASSNQVEPADSTVFIEELFANVVGGDIFLWGWQSVADNKYRLTIQRALEETSKRSRTRLFKQAEKNLITNLPVIPVVVGQSTSTVRLDVLGFYNNILDLHPLKYIYF